MNFAGTAAYGLFDFSSSSTAGRFFLDDFSGTFGSTEAVSEPAAGILVLLGFAVLAHLDRR